MSVTHVTKAGCIALFALLTACKHPIEIAGKGDVLSSSGTRDCLLEDFEAGLPACTENSVTDSAYIETYTASPRPGWKFERWENYCESDTTGECSFDIDRDTVAQFAGGSASSLRAVFTPSPQVVELGLAATFNTPRSARGLLKDGDLVYVADNSATVLVLQLTQGGGLQQLTEIDLTAVDPANAVLAGELSANGLAKVGDYLYVAAQDGGLVVVDVADPTNPLPVYHLDTPDKAYFFTIVGDQLYLSDRQGLIAFDISNPAQPYQIGAIASDITSFMRSQPYDSGLLLAGYVRGVKVISTPAGGDPIEESFNRLNGPLWAVEPFSAGNQDYFLLGGQGTGLIIYDPAIEQVFGSPLPLTDILEPVGKEQIVYNIVSQGHFAYVADAQNGVQVVSLNEIDAPYIAGSWATNAVGEVRDIVVDGKVVIVADSTRGVHLLSAEILSDADGDGFADVRDAFPNDPNEWIDTDGDGIGNNEDTDDDNDGIEDSIDNDADNDGFENDRDMFPNDPAFWIDSDGDGQGDNNELLIVDNESIHASATGDWALRTSGSATLGSSYLVKPADSAGGFTQFNPIINTAANYNIYVPRLFSGDPIGKPQVATYRIDSNGSSSQVYFPQNPPPGKLNYLGEYFLPVGNEASITIADDGTGVADVYADGVWLIPSLTVTDAFESNYNYTLVGTYTNPDLNQWNLKRVFLDPVDPDYLYAAFNQTADICSINISDPTDPTLVQCYVSTDGAGYEVMHKDNYLILANRTDGISVFESFADGQFSPEPIVTLATDDKASRLHINGNLLYVGDTLEGTRIYDITDPSDPILLSVSKIGAESRDIRTLDNLAYVGNYFRGLSVLNVEDPENPVEVYRLNEPDNSYQGGVWDLELTDTHLFMLVQSFGVQIADISDPLNPVVISEIRIPDGLQYPPFLHADQPPLDILLVNNLLVVSNGAHGVLLFDVTDLYNIEIVERIDTPSIAGEAKLRGDLLFVADGKGSGLRIYDISHYQYLYEPL